MVCAKNKTMEYWLYDQPRNDKRIQIMSSFFVFAEILVVFQLVNYYNFFVDISDSWSDENERKNAGHI